MPKRLFFDLTTHKQDTILDAAFSEFSRTDFDHSSINQIIKQANIARGSFYLYFEDKEDLVITLLKYVLTKQFDTYVQRFVPQKLKTSALYRQFIEFMFAVFDDTVYASFFKNIYLAMNYRIKKEFDDFALLFRQRLYDTIQAQSTLGFGQRNPPPIAIEIVSLLTRSLFEKKLAHGVDNQSLLNHYDDVITFLIKQS